jgi:hypothetical protein
MRQTITQFHIPLRAQLMTSLNDQPETFFPATGSITNAAPKAQCEVLDPNSTEALYQDALAETTVTESDAARTLLRSAIIEVRRLQDLLDKAEAQLAKLRAMSPRELAAMAGCTSAPRLRDGGSGFRAALGSTQR